MATFATERHWSRIIFSLAAVAFTMGLGHHTNGERAFLAWVDLTWHHVLCVIEFDNAGIFFVLQGPEVTVRLLRKCHDARVDSR